MDIQINLTAADAQSSIGQAVLAALSGSKAGAIHVADKPPAPVAAAPPPAPVAASAPPPPPPPAPPVAAAALPPPAQPGAPAISATDLTRQVQTYTAQHKATKAKAKLAELGVTKISDIKPENYAAAMALFAV